MDQNQNSQNIVDQQAELEQKEEKQYASTLTNIEQSDQMKKKVNCAYVKTYQELAREKELYEYQNAKKKSYITVKPITTDQISGITQEINNALSLQKANLEQIIDQCFFTEAIKKRGTISVQEIINVLKNDPFKLTESQATDLSRYLIEDNCQDEIKFKLSLEANNTVVKSRIKFAIGKLKVFTPEKEKEIKQQLNEILSKNGEALKFQLAMQGDVKKSLKCTKDQILKCMQSANIEFNQSQSDYFFLKLYENSKTPGKYNYDDTTALFVKNTEQQQ